MECTPLRPRLDGVLEGAGTSLAPGPVSSNRPPPDDSSQELVSLSTCYGPERKERGHEP
jgi:hypothetical protein